MCSGNQKRLAEQKPMANFLLRCNLPSQHRPKLQRKPTKENPVKTPIKIALLLCIATTTALAGDSNYDKLVKLYGEHGLVPGSFVIEETDKPLQIPSELRPSFELKKLYETKNQGETNIPRGKLYTVTKGLLLKNIKVVGVSERRSVNYLQEQFYTTKQPLSYKILKDESIDYEECLALIQKIEGEKLVNCTDKGVFYIPTEKGLVRSRYVPIRSALNGTYGVYFSGTDVKPLAIVMYPDNFHGNKYHATSSGRISSRESLEPRLRTENLIENTSDSDFEGGLYDKLVKLYSKHGPVMTELALVETEEPFKIPEDASPDYSLRTTSKSEGLAKNSVEFGELYVEFNSLFLNDLKVAGSYQRLRVNYLQKHFYHSVLPESFSVLNDGSVNYSQCLEIIHKVEGDSLLKATEMEDYYIPTKSGLVKTKYIIVRSRAFGTYGVHFGYKEASPLYIKSYPQPKAHPRGTKEENEALMKQLEAERKQNQKQAPIMPLGFTRGNGFVPDRSYGSSLKNLAGCLS
jgi:hypothetical protein